MTAPLRVLLVDDEPLARANLRVLLERDPSATICGECGDGRRAVELLRQGRVDLVFLDIQMPGTTGLDVIAQVGPRAMPQVIFTTAYDEYAVAAFEHRAVDFLLKPFSDERFAEVLAHARQRLAERDAARLAGQLASLAGELAPGNARPRGSSWLTVRVAGRLLRLDVAAIRWVEAADYRLHIHHGGDRLTVRRSLDQLQDELAGHGFVRVHRSALVNLGAVREVVRGPAGDATVVLDDGTRLRVARARRAELEQGLSG